MSQDAVLLVGHGTVSELGQLPEFLRRIRRGRPAPDELVAELRHRYSAIGGSPLLAITDAQAAGLSERLKLPCITAMRFWSPTIEERLPELEAYDRLVVLPVAPFSVHIYTQVVREALDVGRAAGRKLPQLLEVFPYGEEPGFLAATVSKIKLSIAEAALPATTELILTAHSLPVSVLRAGDPYAELFSRSAAAIAAGVGMPWRLAYQSQGASGGEWLGPSLEAVLAEVATKAGQGGPHPVVIAPVGFVADHVETLFDLDIEARGWAEHFGLSLTRVPAHNTDPGFLDSLAVVARAALAS